MSNCSMLLDERMFALPVMVYLPPLAEAISATFMWVFVNAAWKRSSISSSLYR